MVASPRGDADGFDFRPSHVNTKQPHAFNYLSESFDKPHDHLCACNMDDEPICNRSCIYCSCWRIEAARAEGRSPLQSTLLALIASGYDEGVQAARDAVDGIKSDPWGQGRIFKDVALRAIDALEKPNA